MSKLGALSLAIAVALIGSASSAQEPKRPITLEMASTFPGSMPVLGDAANEITDRVMRLSGGDLVIKFYEPNVLVPAADTVNAVAAGKVAAAWAGAGWFAGKDSAFDFFSSVPFGPGVAEYMAWLYNGGGLELARELFHAHGVHDIPCGLIPAEAAGWFRKEIKTPEDLKGLRMRIFGLGGLVLRKFGVVTSQNAPGEILTKLKNGSLDAAEFSLPAMDLPLKLYEEAKYYYFPGWHQPSTFFDLAINLNIWNGLSERHKAILDIACGDMVREMVAESEAVQVSALKELVAHGVHLRRWPAPMLVAFEKAWHEVVAEESAKNPNFKRVYDSYAAFRKSYANWRYISALE
ncbi:TRAP transporter substrate-binding protein [Microbacteriaceae bacterium K1510]|nr:TRAP transporter substrate-binding protein [Microbacteriaceae bacterium K1510]